MRIRERPERRPEPERGPPRQWRAPARGGRRRSSAIYAPTAGVLGDVAVKAIADLDLELLRGDVVEELPDLRILAIDDRYHLEQLVERNRDRGSFDGKFDHRAR